MGDEEEREREKEGRMTWTSVSAEIMMWRCLEKKKKFSLLRLLIYIYNIIEIYIVDVMCGTLVFTTTATSPRPFLLLNLM